MRARAPEHAVLERDEAESRGARRTRSSCACEHARARAARGAALTKLASVESTASAVRKTASCVGAMTTWSSAIFPSTAGASAPGSRVERVVPRVLQRRLDAAPYTIMRATVATSTARRSAACESALAGESAWRSRLVCSACACSAPSYAAAACCRPGRRARRGERLGRARARHRQAERARRGGAPAAAATASSTGATTGAVAAATPRAADVVERDREGAERERLGRRTTSRRAAVVARSGLRGGTRPTTSVVRRNRTALRSSIRSMSFGKMSCGLAW